MLRPPLLLSLLLLPACVPDEGPAEAREGSAAEGALFFAENCSGCHGADARDGGPAAAGLDPPPADLTRIAARNGGTFPESWVMSTINGFHRDVRPGSAMPAFDLEALGPTIVVELTDGIGTPVPTTLLALTRHLESVQQ